MASSFRTGWTINMTAIVAVLYTTSSMMAGEPSWSTTDRWRVQFGSQIINTTQINYAYLENDNLYLSLGEGMTEPLKLTGKDARTMEQWLAAHEPGIYLDEMPGTQIVDPTGSPRQATLTRTSLAPIKIGRYFINMMKFNYVVRNGDGATVVFGPAEQDRLKLDVPDSGALRKWLDVHLSCIHWTHASIVAKPDPAAAKPDLLKPLAPAMYRPDTVILNSGAARPSRDSPIARIDQHDINTARVALTIVESDSLVLIFGSGGDNWLKLTGDSSRSMKCWFATHQSNLSLPLAPTNVSDKHQPPTGDRLETRK